jgi:DMSO/TMAO reductase YedYZ molybdopterin-dependent catalytic subunit
MTRRWAALGGLAATALATALMFWLRGVFQIRTLPERLTEWALLFVPPEQFERAITTFGTQAKVYALYGAVAAMAAVLVGTGAVAARSATGPWAAGGGLWLLAMAVVMPLTGGGAFGRELPQDALLVNAAFAAVALAYVLTLLAARALAVPAAAAPSAARRSLLVGAGATAASFAALWLLRGRIGGRTDLPLATFDEPTPGPVAAAAAAPAGRPHPSPLPEGAGTRGQTTPPGTTPVATGPPTAVAPTAVASPTAPAKPTVEVVPQPPPVRELKREHDGASTAVPRKSGELSTFVTPNELFYITTKNPVSDPVVDGAGWRLAIDGEVGRPVQLDYRTLRRLPAVELHRTLECISNFVDKPELAPFGNGLISNAVWRGARLGDVLGLAGGVKPTGKWLTLVTADEFNAVVPAELAADPECVLAYEMNGQVLPREHGYPARLLVPGRYGLKSAKWVIAIRAHEKEMLDWYGQRGWSKDGFVKTMSRIDTPASGTAPPAGRQRIAGVAYAADRGVTKVEYSADGGRSWREAEIVERAPSGKDSWVIWQGAFEMPSGGKVSLRARATDGRGELQIETFSLPQPDGASGWHTVELPSR